jgi:hypothetical protein
MTMFIDCSCWNSLADIENTYGGCTIKVEKIMNVLRGKLFIPDG